MTTSGPHIILAALCFSLLLTSPAYAEIYKYRDDSGRLIFVDDKDKIPAKYREEIRTLDESESNLGSFKAPPGRQQEELSVYEAEPVKPEVKKKATDKLSTDVEIKGNRVLVPVEVGLGNHTVELTLLLDTGATRTVFHRNALSALDLPSGRRYKARVAGGGIVSSTKIRFRHITVGPYKMEKAYAMVINLKGSETPFDGMLGMDFLKSHPYQIDFDKQLIFWEETR